MISDKTPIQNRFVTIDIEPTSYPVTVDEIKEFARIDGNDNDDLLETFLIGAIKDIEDYLGRALIIRTYKMIMDVWDKRDLELLYPPLISVTSITTVDEDDVETTYSDDYYFIITESIPGRVVIKRDFSLPTNTLRDQGGFRITYTAGYGSASDIPKPIKIAIMQWVTMIYEKRSMTDNDIEENEPPSEVIKSIKTFRVLRA